jgi:D-alanyl-D-alanine carboxypeptidase
MLLRHTSGLAEYLDLAAQEPARRWEPAELIALAEGRGRVGAPGAGYAYSNANYIALGEIIEQVTGNAWDEEVRRRIVEPLGLTSTRPVAVSEQAAAHSFVDGAWIDVTGSVDPSIGGAAGALESTVTDLLRFARAIADGSLVSAGLRAEMEAFVPAEDYSAFGVEHSYGLGLERYETAGVTVLGHLGVGAGAGQRAFVGFDPERGNVVTVQFNSDVAGPQAVLAIEILEALAADDVSAG